MSNEISEAQVRHVAKLSRLKLTDEQINLYTRQLGAILEYIKKLNELDTTGVEPMAHVAPLRNVLRDDIAGTGMGIDKVLQNAPDSDPPFFKVPRVLEDSSGA
ncbi:MAG: Asp-tRNA(Asn)/Glu-tRNA(Gln) amidotransferase subunit GatC [Phycisphaerae bacterium]|jgi:aspartyl-tRNA(Asn)/glutamyl-tRNA(Gln) amidotransferase subunit C|nr:Asp-tRNA(Asn)/Glu-tRNA(Gln) amidotransferase subunit GatC [Phycisphaerae bacterium]